MDIVKNLLEPAPTPPATALAPEQAGGEHEHASGACILPCQWEPYLERAMANIRGVLDCHEGLSRVSATLSCIWGCSSVDLHEP